MILIGLRIAPEQQLLAWLFGREEHVHHLHGGELFQKGSRREPAGDLAQLGLQGHLQAVRQLGHENVRLDTLLFLVKDRADLQIVFEIPEGRLDSH